MHVCVYYVNTLRATRATRGRQGRAGNSVNGPLDPNQRETTSPANKWDSSGPARKKRGTCLVDRPGPDPWKTLPFSSTPRKKDCQSQLCLLSPVTPLHREEDEDICKQRPPQTCRLKKKETQVCSTCRNHVLKTPPFPLAPRPSDNVEKHSRTILPVIWLCLAKPSFEATGADAARLFRVQRRAAGPWFAAGRARLGPLRGNGPQRETFPTEPLSSISSASARLNTLTAKYASDQRNRKPDRFSTRRLVRIFR